MFQRSTSFREATVITPRLASTPGGRLIQLAVKITFGARRKEQEKSMRKSKTCLVALNVFVSLLYFIALSPETLAQSAFTGVARDQSGAVLPGVSVEARS